MALLINHDEAGKVTGIVCAGADGVLHEQKARAVCVAGNVIETSQLLLNSASSLFPDGLGNGSGHLGRNYMRHVMHGTLAIMPGPVHFERGPRQSGMILDEQRHDPSRGFAGGYIIETIADHPNSVAMKAHAARQCESLFRGLGARQFVSQAAAGHSTYNMGGARMSTRPTDGVTNRRGRLHEITNLFVSDGSLFPSSGTSNPTLTIVALAIRQAEHIADATARREL